MNKAHVILKRFLFHSKNILQIILLTGFQELMTIMQMYIDVHQFFGNLSVTLQL